MLERPEAEGIGECAGFDPVAYINTPRWRGSRLGLERIRELMERLGNPQNTLRFVHVAGTNGKGSTCALIASVLQRAGFKVGLFTSPYIICFEERIRVNGCNISPEDLLYATLRVREQAEAMDDHPTEFELMCAVALLHFARVGCDICVLEVGLGGRFDATNVIAAPLVCAIAPIALDHTQLLGTTLAQIAAEKAGIIKHGCPVLSAVQEPEAARVLQDVCQQQGCSLAFVDAASLQGTPAGFGYRGYEDLRIGLLGSYQTHNAALAIDAIEALRAQGFKISDAALREGLARTSWPGRFEVVASEPTFIVDGGHNAQGALALASSLQLNFPGRKAVFLLGVLADKDYPAMIEALLPYARAFVCIAPPNPRALPAAELALAVFDACLLHRSVEVLAVGSIEQGVRLAREAAGPSGLVCACGSLYSIGAIQQALQAKS